MNTALMLSTIHQCLSTHPIDPTTFAELFKTFNLTSTSPYDPNPFATLKEKFKNQLLNIFNSEGANYHDYLQLRKFDSLKQETKQTLRTLFDRIWTEYQKKDQIDKPFKMLPQFKTLDQVEAFHLELLKSFRSSKLCRQNTQSQNKQHQFSSIPSMNPQLLYSKPHNSSFLAMDSQPKFTQNSLPIMKNHISHPDNRTVFPKVQDDPRFSNQRWVDQMHASDPSVFPVEKMPVQHQNSFVPPKQVQRPSLQPNSYSKRVFKPTDPIQASHASQYSMDHSSQQKQHVAQNDSDLQQKINAYLFMQCSCQGNLPNPSAPYMVCKGCQFHFHHECLLMDENSKAELCPCCKLKQGSNMFMKIHEEAYGKRWCRYMKSQKLSLILTERQIEKLKTEKMKCNISSQIEYQLRFLKIIRKTKHSKTSSIQLEDRSKKFNNIPLPSQFIERIQPHNPFQISIKPPEEDRNDESIYFFSIFMVQKFSEQWLTEQLFSNINTENSVDESYIRQFLLPSQEFLQIKIKDPTSQRRIQYSVRGNHCQHPEVFDYLSFLQYYKAYGQKLKEKHCPICDLEIDQMVVDRFIMQKIRHLEEAPVEYRLMKYYGEGKVQFIEEAEEVEEESDGEDDNELSEEDSESDEASDSDYEKENSGSRLF